MKSFLFTLLVSIACFFFAQAQNGVISGKVVNILNKEPIPFASVAIVGTTKGTTTDEGGKFTLTGLSYGVYNIIASSVGFRSKTMYEVEVKNAKSTFLIIELESGSTSLKEVEVTAQTFNKTDESPVSLRSIGVTEIKRNPGGNRDISRVVQSLPGVQVSSSFRNDLIVRGGSPNENRFFLNGIEIPVINHFTTQGASGGPVGMINVDFIREVKLYSGAFPANRGNALSSTLEFEYKDARQDKPAYTLTLGATDFAATVEAPVSKKVGIIAGYRRSYLQFLFSSLGLPFLPKYDDFQFKAEARLSSKDIIDVIGIGAYDVVSLNLQANETDAQKIILKSIPRSSQWNYTVGARYRHFKENSYYTVVVSRSHLNNEAIKYLNNDESTSANLTFKYDSYEIENKIRIENTTRINGYKINAGFGFEDARYYNFVKQKFPFIGEFSNQSNLQFYKYSGFVQASKNLMAGKLIVSAGLRTDGSTFNSNMQNPLKQVSPRVSLAYSLNEHWSINANSGIYYQLPPYTALGVRNNLNELVNRNLKYISCSHQVLGVEYNTMRDAKITLEGFYKQYRHYPFNLRDSISLANQGSDFGVVGDAPMSSNNEGRSYGVEFLYQQKLRNNFYCLLAYTLVRSEFQNLNNEFVPSAWDAVHLVSATAGKIFKRNIQLGAKLRLNSGLPYTPFDVNATVLKSNYDISGNGILDKSKYNANRLPVFYQLDVRLDKKYNFKKWLLNVYIDIQNVTNAQIYQPPLIAIERDSNGNPLTSPTNPDSYIPRLVENTSGTLIPGLGVVVEF